ncbi:MAG: SDR family NAD(P)-dependent oxidoreductase [Pseudomonadota bacterium]
MIAINGKRVLLTGAAGGLGRAIARGLHARGAKLVLSGRNAVALQALANELAAQVITCDLADAADITRMVAAAGDIDVLVANAGIAGTAPITDFSTAEVDQLLDVNLRAPILLSQALIASMKQRGGGHLVFVSSMAGKGASPFSGLYSASKFGLRGFTQCLRMDLRSSNIGVSTIFPGMIRDAGMFADAGVPPPPGVGTNTSAEVAQAVVRAIERNLGEVAVAPLMMRIASVLAALAPEASAAMVRAAGAEKFAEKFAAGRRKS